MTMLSFLVSGLALLLAVLASAALIDPLRRDLSEEPRNLCLNRHHWVQTP